jgi:hypothetical protein
VLTILAVDESVLSESGLEVEISDSDTFEYGNVFWKEQEDQRRGDMAGRVLCW